MTGRSRWAAQELGYAFTEESLLEQALTHRSASRSNNERLEFLGDAMLSLTVARSLYEMRPDAEEGDLSRARAALVNRTCLARIGRRIAIDEHLILGGGELGSGGAQRDSTLADAVEAVIGAVVLDGGYLAAESLVLRLLKDEFASLPDSESLKDAKTRLQEWLQARGQSLPEYKVDGVGGSDHNQIFVVRCMVAKYDKTSSGEGTSRRRAEQAAAEAMLIKLTGGDG